MTDAAMTDLYGALAKITATPAGQVQLAHFEPLFTRVASGYLDPATRPTAEALMKGWADGEDPLRKGMAQHWLDRAHAIVEGGMAAGSAVPMGRQVHPMIARILASRKKPLKKFDESKHKRDHGEFSSEGGAAPVASAHRPIAEGHSTAFAHHMTAAMSGGTQEGRDFHLQHAAAHQDAATAAHAAADKAGEPAAHPSTPDEPVDNRSAFGRLRDWSRRMAYTGSGISTGAGVGAAVGLAGGPAGAAIGAAVGGIAGGFIGHKIARVTE